MINIICEDTLKWLETNKEKFHICFTSPPYNWSKKNNFSWKKKGEDKNHYAKYLNDSNNDIIDDYVGFSVKVIKKLLDCCEYVFWNIQSIAGNKKDLIEIKYQLREYFCDEIIWYKKNGIPNGFNKRVMTNTFEYIWIFSKNNSRAVGTNIENWKIVTNHIELPGQQGKNRFSNIHKATFPLELAMTIIERFTQPGHKIIDCFGGIGTTAVAAYKLNRDCILIDKEPIYIETAKQWLKEEQEKENNNEK